MANLIGQTLGGYRIVEQTGLGGMATVFKAYQPSIDRYVALKVLSTHLTQDPTFVKRCRQEAKVIARLEHARILPVYDHGEQDGHLIAKMVEGTLGLTGSGVIGTPHYTDYMLGFRCAVSAEE